MAGIAVGGWLRHRLGAPMGCLWREGKNVQEEGAKERSVVMVGRV